MPPIAFYQELATLALTVFTVIGLLVGAYGWVSGKLPFWIGKVIKWKDDRGEEVSLPDLSRTAVEAKEMTHVLEKQHQEVVDELNNVKATQVDIAIAVNNPEMVIPIDELRERHFGHNGHAHTGDLVQKRGDKGFDD